MTLFIVKCSDSIPDSAFISRNLKVKSREGMNLEVEGDMKNVLSLTRMKGVVTWWRKDAISAPEKFFEDTPCFTHG